MALLVMTGDIWPDHGVNDCLDQIAAKLTAVSGLDAVYDHRAGKTELDNVVSITAVGDVPADTPHGVGLAYDYIADVLIKIDDDYRTAERKLNDICTAIVRALWGSNEPYWSDCYVYAGSQKPASPQDYIGWRRGIVYIRVIPQ